MQLRDMGILMTTVVLGCTTALSGAGAGGGAISTPAALMKADRDFAVATHTRGIDGWMSFFAPDAIRIKYRGDMVKGASAIRDFDEPGIADTASVLNWEPTDAHVFRDGTSGSTTGRYSVISRKTIDAGKELGHGRYVTMWRLENGRWLVVMDTGYPEPATPPR
ncbi:MAG TPA: nuclear transport factor 2 family protein [Gemmatimonadaceae bacterium]|nr:nuclear transport factor 2 family protein [Gemmatimonadaceae bacterium]